MVTRLMMPCVWLVCVLLGSFPAWAQGALSPERPEKPLLRLDPGMHTAVVRQIATNRDCSLLISGSEDKSIKVWRLPAGRVLSTLRPPSGEDNNGRVYSVAMPPDGQWIASGGWTQPGGNHYVYVFDPDKRMIVTRFGPFEIIDALAASDDGRLLAAALRNGQGIRIWERRANGEWSLKLRDGNYPKGDARGLSFDREGNLYVTARDATLRRYPQVPAAKMQSVRVRSGLLPAGVAMSPDGNKLVVGYADTTAIDIYDSRTLGHLYAANTRGLSNGNLAAVAWSSDGSRIFAGGTYAQDGKQVLLAWGTQGQAAEPKQIASTTDAILSLASCGDGIAMASGEPGLWLFGNNAQRMMALGPAGPDMRGKVADDFTVSADGTKVRFGLERGGGEPVLIDVANEVLVEQSLPLSDLQPAKTTGLPVTDWENSRAPKFADKPILLDPEERAQSMAISPDGSGFVIGGDYQLRAYDKSGFFQWRRRAPSVVWGVNITGNGKLVVAACGDGSLRWYRMSDGVELLSVFVNVHDLRWVAWSPSGYFTAPQGGESMIGWQVNRRGNPTPDYFPVNKFRDIYYRPDVINRMLSALDEETAISLADEALTRRRERLDVVKNTPPVVRIVSPRDGAFVDEGELKVKFAVRYPSGTRIKRVFAQIGGRPVVGAELRDLDVPEGAEAEGDLTVKVPAREIFTLSVIAEPDKGAASEPARVDLSSTIPQVLAVKPRLFVLGIGVGTYKDEKLNLGEFPRNDITDFVEVMTNQEGRLFEKVTSRVLLDENATKANITDGMQWLIDNAKDSQWDIAVMYFSGHGASIPAGASYVLPFEYDRAKVTSGLSKSVILDSLRGINAPVLFFVDACHAGDDLKLGPTPGMRRLDAGSLASELSSFENGITAFASSNGRELSRGSGRNSYFTQVVIDSLKGHGLHKGTTVLTDDVGRWLRQRVPELTDRRQLPVFMPSQYVQPLPLAVVKAGQN